MCLACLLFFRSPSPDLFECDDEQEKVNYSRYNFLEICKVICEDTNVSLYTSAGLHKSLSEIKLY